MDFAAGRNRYIGYLISIATRSFKNMKVALDCANGSASAIAKNVFDALGAETHVMNNEPNGLNINTDCGSTHIAYPAEVCGRNQECDVGFAYDGDADRCIAVDENGSVVDGDANHVHLRQIHEGAWEPCSTIPWSPPSCPISDLYKAFDREGICLREDGSR